MRCMDVWVSGISKNNIGLFSLATRNLIIHIINQI